MRSSSRSSSADKLQKVQEIQDQLLASIGRAANTAKLTIKATAYPAKDALNNPLRALESVIDMAVQENLVIPADVAREVIGKIKRIAEKRRLLYEKEEKAKLDKLREDIAHNTKNKKRLLGIQKDVKDLMKTSTRMDGLKKQLFDITVSMLDILEDASVSFDEWAKSVSFGSWADQSGKKKSKSKTKTKSKSL